VKVKPMLGDWEIPHIEEIGSIERRSFVELAVPGQTQSLYQDLSATPTRVAITGSLYGDEDRDAFLEEVRGKFRAGEPLTFVADIVTATELQYVVIEQLRFEQSATRPDEIKYSIAVRQSPPPPPPPDPLGGLDTSILDEAGGFLGTVTGALDALETLGNIPDFGNPLPPLQSSLDNVKQVSSGLGDTIGGLNDLFGIPEA
jgi:hypothetical protein